MENSAGIIRPMDREDLTVRAGRGQTDRHAMAKVRTAHRSRTIRLARRRSRIPTKPFDRTGPANRHTRTGPIFRDRLSRFCRSFASPRADRHFVDGSGRPAYTEK
jgi:hypothetical protein